MFCHSFPLFVCVCILFPLLLGHGLEAMTIYWQCCIPFPAWCLSLPCWCTHTRGEILPAVRGEESLSLPVPVCVCVWVGGACESPHATRLSVQERNCDIWLKTYRHKIFKSTSVAFRRFPPFVLRFSTTLCASLSLLAIYISSCGCAMLLMFGILLPVILALECLSYLLWSVLGPP